MIDKNIILKLEEQAKKQHAGNRKRIRYGFISMILSPFILYFILWVTDSDKIAFIIIWGLIMFIIAIYLLMIAYRDSRVDENFRELTGKDFGPEHKSEPEPEKKEDES